MGSKEGTLKVAAKRLGLSVHEYMNHINNGLKSCTICKKWKSINAFGKDSSRGDGRKCKCMSCCKGLHRHKSITRSETRVERRPGDKIQARKRINSDVELGLRPNPNDLYCSFCGHKDGDKRHEYHHHMGYDKDHHYDVIPLCTTCHRGEH